MKNTRKGFTLVELIVVITILAILGSIAFVSLQGYSADARNSKRTSDLNSLQNAMSVKTTEGASLMSFVSSTTDAKLSTVSIGGTTPASGEYDAGTPNYSALGVKQADFQDPLSNTDYKVGATSLKLGQYELAASMEQGSGNKVAKIVGNYTARDAEDIWTVNDDVLEITSSADINKLFVGDTISDGTDNAKVISISADWMKLKLNTGALDTNSGWLATDETEGLIDSVGTTGAEGVVLDGGTLLPY